MYIYSLKILIGSAFVSNGRLAQSVECGANNAYVMSSRLKRTRFHFLFGDYFLFLSSLRKLTV